MRARPGGPAELERPGMVRDEPGSTDSMVLVLPAAAAASKKGRLPGEPVVRVFVGSVGEALLTHIRSDDGIVDFDRLAREALWTFYNRARELARIAEGSGCRKVLDGIIVDVGILESLIRMSVRRNAIILLQDLVDFAVGLCRDVLCSSGGGQCRCEVLHRALEAIHENSDESVEKELGEFVEDMFREADAWLREECKG
ncbi:MAG: hypothetical protein F7C34_03955 [Desulfurococcales archaeon]|nr:hypothetical protein [Desulfurococcales archaeon]